MDSPEAKGDAVRRALVDMVDRMTERPQQELSLGPKPAEGTSLGISVLVGQLSTEECGAFHSPMRTATEQAVKTAVYNWSVEHGARTAGWFLSLKWRRRGSPHAALDVKATGVVPHAAHQAFLDWGDRSDLRLPHPQFAGQTLVVPCVRRPTQVPMHHVKVVFHGLSELYAYKGAPGAILRAVGYRGGLKISDVFFGIDPDLPYASDGSVCAYVIPPPGDPKLSLLPATLHLGCVMDDVLQVYVSSRSAATSTVPDPGPSHAWAGAPPPPPPRSPPPRAGAAGGGLVGAAAARAGAPPATVATAARGGAPPPARAAGLPRPVAVPARRTAAQSDGDSMSVDGQPDQPAGAADAMLVDGEGPAGGASAAQPAAAGAASPTRAAAARRILAEWAAAEFPTADTVDGELQRLLAAFVASPRGAGVVAQWAAAPGDLEPEVLPPSLSSALVAWFQGQHGHPRQQAYGGSASSSGGGTPLAPARRPPGEGPRPASAGRQRQRPLPQPGAPRRSPRQSLGVPPSCGALTRGAPLAANRAASADRARPRQRDGSPPGSGSVSGYRSRSSERGAASAFAPKERPAASRAKGGGPGPP